MEQLHFPLGKALWLVLAPSHFLLLILLLAVILFKSKPKLSYLLSSFVTIIFVLIALTPVEHLVLAPLEQRISPPSSLNNIDSVVVLGGGQQKKQSHQFPYSGFGQHTGRMIAAIDLARQLNVPLIFVGGQEQGNHEIYLESTSLTTLLNMTKLSPAQVFINNSSHDTYDNAIQAKKILVAQQLKQSLLITSAAHMPRAFGVFQQQEINVVPFPVEYKLNKESHWFSPISLVKKLYLIEYGVHEWLGLTKYYLLGMTQSFLPLNSNQ